MSGEPLKSDAAIALEAIQERDEARREAREWENEYREHLAVCDTAEFEHASAVKAKLEAAQAEVERLREALPDPELLDTVADWIDAKYPNDADPEVQRDLRRWAEQAREALNGKESQ